MGREEHDELPFDGGGKLVFLFIYLFLVLRSHQLATLLAAMLIILDGIRASC